MIDQAIDSKLLTQAIKVLRELNQKYNINPKKKSLLEDENEPAVFLQFSLKKIPKCKNVKMIKINLPHSLFKENKDVCLITGDLDKKNHKAEIEPDVLHYKELLKKHGIDNVSEVVTLRQLRTEYKPYEAKQKLLAAYDVFLADRKIAECLPKILGRHFFRKRKFPIQITLNTPNLKKQVEKGLATQIFYLTGHGNSCNSEVAYLNMSDQDISENVLEMAKSVCDKLPGSYNNVMGIYLKTALSKAIPVYLSYDDPNKVYLKDEPTDNSFEIDELSTCPNSMVKVYKDGSVRTVRKRKAETEPCDIANVSGDSKKKKKENIIDNNELSDCNSLTATDLNDGTADISKYSIKKNKKKKSIIDNTELSDFGSLAAADLNGESNQIDKKPRNSRKSMGNTLIKEDDESVINTKLKDESNQINKKSRNSRKSVRNALMKENDESVVSTKLEDESNQINKKPKSSRKSVGNTLMREDDESVVNIELEDESNKMNRKSRSSRKSMGNTLIKEDDENAVNGKLEGEPINKKPRNGRKSVGNTLMREDDESGMNNKLEGKQKKRKSLVNKIVK